MPTEKTFKSTLSDQPIGPDDRPSTMGLLGRMVNESLKLQSPRVTERRIRWLLTKTHTTGPITLNLPTMVGFRELQRIQHLRDTDPAGWVLECLFILAHQRNEDAIFLFGQERQIAIQQYADRIGLMATDLPAYTIAILEMLSALEKKSASYSANLHTLSQQTLAEISRLASSPSPNPPASPSNTSQPNSTSSSSTST